MHFSGKRYRKLNFTSAPGLWRYWDSMWKWWLLLRYLKFFLWNRLSGNSDRMPWMFRSSSVKCIFFFILIAYSSATLWEIKGGNFISSYKDAPGTVRRVIQMTRPIYKYAFRRIHHDKLHRVYPSITLNYKWWVCTTSSSREMAKCLLSSTKTWLKT